MTDRLLQHRADDGTRTVLLADDDGAAILAGVASVRELALAAIAEGASLADAARSRLTGRRLDLPAELAAGRLLAAIDHPDPARLMMAGTGLTHLGSAEGRDAMHKAAASTDRPTDSMRMFLEGVEGGKPIPGERGQQPEWFYKGSGYAVCGPGDALFSPDFALDGG